LASSNLPSLTFRGAESRGYKPEIFANPALFDGILWRRVGAYFFDAILIVAINVALHVLLVFLGLLTFGVAWLLLGPITCLTVALAYGTLFIGGGEGATPGMRLCDIEARGLDGGRPGYFQAFLMTALFYATVPVTSFLILIVAFFTEHNRTAHDFLSGITVVRRSR
jgi:uncharacterized RDD family membrane protein YckC